jgi:hypothetical protein
MKRILTYTLSGILITATGLGVLSQAGEIPQGQSGGSYDSQPAQTQYNNGQDTRAMEKDFQNQMRESAAQQNENELERRQYIPRYMEGSSGTVTGTVTLVGDNEMRMVESGTGIEHQISISKAQQKELTTGYNIRAELKNGKLVSFTDLGVPPNVEKIVYSAEDLPTTNILEQQKAL